jgi:hypothetical protein
MFVEQAEKMKPWRDSPTGVCNAGRSDALCRPVQSAMQINAWRRIIGQSPVIAQTGAVVRLNKTLSSLHKLLAGGSSMVAGLGLCAGAWGNCLSPDTGADNCFDAYSYDWREVIVSVPASQALPEDPGTPPEGYAENRKADILQPEAGLRFDTPSAVPTTASPPAARGLTVSNTASEPPFALLFGGVGRVMSDGSVALGRGADRSHSNIGRRSAFTGLLPPAFDTWDNRLDVDVGLSFSGNSGFRTSIGYAESIGNANLDPAFVGWFEFHF